jgi:Rrf2 family nitric oxide-sensitive transcriptional repressor
MRLTVYTDYSLRMLTYVALRREALATIQDVAEAYGISKNHLMKVAYQLGQHGYLETVRGRNGGLRLARKPGQIKIGDVVRAMEDDFTMVECFDADTGRCAIARPCRLRGVLFEALNAYMKVLDRYTLADLMAPHRELSRILQPA